MADDAIDKLITANVALIKTLTEYNVWAKYVPSTEAMGCYVLVTTASGNTTNAKNKRLEDVRITVAVYVRTTAIDADKIMANIKAGIYPSNNKCNIDISPLKAYIFGCTDESPGAIQFGDATFVNRFTTFNYKIVYPS